MRCRLATLLLMSAAIPAAATGCNILTPSSTPTPVIIRVYVTATPVPCPTPSATPTPAPTRAPLPVIVPGNARQLAQISRIGAGRWHDLAWSPDGEVVAAANSIGLYILDADNLKQAGFLEPGYAIQSLAYSPDGRTLVTGDDYFAGSAIRFWNADTLRQFREVVAHRYGPIHVAFSPRDLTVATVNELEPEAKLWDSDSGTLRRTLSAQNSNYSVAFSPDGHTLATGGGYEDEMVRIWNISTGEMLHSVDVGAIVGSVAFSPDGRTLALGLGGNAGGVLATLEVDSGLVLLRKTVLDEWVGAVAWSPNGATLALGGGRFGYEVQLRDAETGKLQRELIGHTAPVADVAFAPDQQRIATASWDGTVRLWDTATGRQLYATEGGIGSVRCLEFSADGRSIAVGSDGRGVAEFDVITGEPLKEHVSCLDWGKYTEEPVPSPDGRVLAKVVHNEILLLDGESGEILTTLTGHTSNIVVVVFSPDGRMIASGSVDNTVRTWAVLW